MIHAVESAQFVNQMIQRMTHKARLPTVNQTPAPNSLELN